MLHIINKADFREYMGSSGEHYIYHPYENLAFHSYGESKDGKYFCKPKQGKEFPIDKYDRKYLEGHSYHIIVPPKNYTKF